MEWLLIPGMVLALFGVALVILWLGFDWSNVPLGTISVMLAFGFLVAVIGCPINFYDSKTSSMKAQAYYEQFIEPNVTERGDSYVVISNPEAGIWQAGDYTLAGFNNYLTTTRYWDGVPVLGSCVYPAPDLPFVRVK